MLGSIWAVGGNRLKARWIRGVRIGRERDFNQVLTIRLRLTKADRMPTMC